jgi:phosphoribosylformimino-5-aminoimidazole carboxamide ribotide isomerase
MIVYPALDLRAGRTVQLEGGRPERERVSLADPVAVAQRWVAAGFRALHVVDLDAALGLGENRELIAEVIQSVNVPVQVGGGIRDDAAAQAVLDAGAQRIIVGTRAVEQPAWLEQLAAAYPDRVIAAADVRDGAVLTRGWTAVSDRPIEQFLHDLSALPLAAVLVTDVSREGAMQGIDRERFAALTRATAHSLIAAGGIANMEDLRALEDAGAAGAVLGMALYTGAIDGALAAEEFPA